MTEYASEIDIDAARVARLVGTQFPQWAHYPLERVKSAGTDNAIYRLGTDMAVRLPRFQSVADHVEKEYLWLPKLAPTLPLIIPTPLGKGLPSDSYPWPWSIYRWIEGDAAIIERIADRHQTATMLGKFINSLQKIDPTDGPLSGQQNAYRGVPLAMRDNRTRASIKDLHTILDVDALTAAWDVALHAPPWQDPPVWLHGDLHSGNLLAKSGRLTAVIDFGLMGVGDPACDVMVGWTLLSADTRETFRAALSVDDATWARGRGWALSFGVIALAYYLNRNPGLATIARQTLDEVLADYR